MTSVAEAELGALFITAKETILIQKTLSKMGWPQPPSPLKTDNSTAEGVVNTIVFLLKIDGFMLSLVRCHKTQGQFRYYWAPGILNWGNYSTKHHPPDYHERNCEIHARTSH